MTSKERSNLRGQASKIESIYQVGKGNLTQNQLEGIIEAIDKRELIKISVLRGCELSVDEVADFVAKSIKASIVCTIGNKVVLYKKSNREDIEHIKY